jgi:hypothetical protein
VFGTFLIYHSKFRENMRMKNLQNIPAFTKHGQTLEYYQSKLSVLVLVHNDSHITVTGRKLFEKKITVAL